MDIEIEAVEPLRFADGSPVRAASAVTPLGEGFLVVQDDTTHAAWFRDGTATKVRLLPPVEGLEVFDEASGTKHLKPDMEAACQVEVAGRPAVLVLGSGSDPRRMRWSLVTTGPGEAQHAVADMSPLYARVADELAVAPDELNLEGACLVGGALRWFSRGLPSAGLSSGSVDLDLATALEAVVGRAEPESVPVTDPWHYELGRVSGVGLALTDAVVLPGGDILASAAAEDSPDVRDDGPVVGAALVRLEGREVVDVASLPLVDEAVCKVEGLMLLEAAADRVRLLGVVDGDDPEAPSLAIRLAVSG